MSKSQLNIRITDDIATALDHRVNSTSKTKTALVCEALSAYLNLSDDSGDIDTIWKRLRLLERKIEGMPEVQPKKKKTPKKETPKEVPAKLGDLITLDEIAYLTGYKKSSVQSKMSKSGIQAIKRVDRNRAGLYDKNEIIEKIGYKP